MVLKPEVTLIKICVYVLSFFMLKVHAGENFKNRCIETFEAKESTPHELIHKKENSTSEEIEEVSRSRALSFKAVNLFKKKNYKAALKEFTRALESNDNYYAAHYLYEIAYEELGKLREALTDLTRVIEMNPDGDNRLAHSRHTELRIKIENYKKTIKNFIQISELNDNHLIYYLRGVSYENLGNLEKALADYTRIIQRKKFDDIFVYIRRAEVYRKMKRPELEKKDREHILLQKSVDEEAFRFKESTRQKSKEKKKRSISIKKSEEYYIKGVLLFEKKNYKVAIKELTKAVKIDPKYFQAFYYRARSYIKKQDYSKAIKDFTRALKLGDNNHLTYFFRGVAYENLGNLEKALADYTKAIEIKPDIFDISVHSRRAEVYRKMQKPELEKKDREYILLQENTNQE